MFLFFRNRMSLCGKFNVFERRRVLRKLWTRKPLFWGMNVRKFGGNLCRDASDVYMNIKPFMEYLIFSAAPVYFRTRPKIPTWESYSPVESVYKFYMSVSVRSCRLTWSEASNVSTRYHVEIEKGFFFFFPIFHDVINMWRILLRRRFSLVNYRHLMQCF